MSQSVFCLFSYCFGFSLFELLGLFYDSIGTLRPRLTLIPTALRPHFLFANQIICLTILIGSNRRPLLIEPILPPIASGHLVLNFIL